MLRAMMIVGALALRVASLGLLLPVLAAAAATQEGVYGGPSMPQDTTSVFSSAGNFVFEPLLAASESEASVFSLPPQTVLGQSEAPEGWPTGGAGESVVSSEDWTWQPLPSGLIYRSYLAGEKEPRMGCTWAYERNWGWMWDITLGGRVGLVRYGTTNAGSPEGFQIDMEGAAQPRLDLEHMEDVLATDFRFGIPLTFGNSRFQTKLAAYHLSSHMGDELMIRRQSFDRLNYSRNVLVWGNSYFWTDEVRLYAEAGWAFYAEGGSEPWEFQFGIEYAPSQPTGSRPAPFVAINSHLREEVNFGGNLVFQSGWAWRGVHGQMFRVGMQYYTGKSDQYEFFNEFEDKLGLGLWYDY